MSARRRDALESDRSREQVNLERLATMSFQSDPNAYKKLAADFHHANNKHDHIEWQGNFVYALSQAVLRGWIFIFVACVFYYTSEMYVTYTQDPDSGASEHRQSFKSAAMKPNEILCFYIYVAYLIFYGSRLSDYQVRANAKALSQAISRLYTVIKLQPFVS
jgi:hypothetical protein